MIWMGRPDRQEETLIDDDDDRPRWLCGICEEGLDPQFGFIVWTGEEEEPSHSCNDIACMANMVALGYEHMICQLEYAVLEEYIEFIEDDIGQGL